MVNLYPFEATVAKAGCTLEDAIENIDIGGPAMVRSAAKNWKDVGVLTDASQYAAGAGRAEGRRQAVATRRSSRCAVAAFNRISDYDGAISDYLSGIQDHDGPGQARALFPGQSNGRFVKLQDLRYGENPHQQAAFYRDLYPAPGSLVTARQLQGKELSYNNIADADAAWECVKSFDAPACVIVKHANPCGVALGKDPLEAYSQGLQDRPDLGLRRHHRLQPPARRRRRAGGGQAVRRGADGAGLHARGAGGVQGQGQRAPAARSRCRPAAPPTGTTAATRSTSSASARAC